MSLKARLRGAIVALVTAVVVVMSLLYLSDFTKASFSAASDRADLVADQFHIYLENHLNVETTGHGLHPASVNQWEDAWTGIIRKDPDITEMLKATLAKADLALAILITDEHGDILAAAAAGDSQQRLCGRRRYPRDPAALVGRESVGSDDAPRKLCVHAAHRDPGQQARAVQYHGGDPFGSIEAFRGAGAEESGAGVRAWRCAWRLFWERCCPM